MNRGQILSEIKALSKCQGFYGRLLSYINSLDESEYESLMSELESQNFKDSIDIVLYFEC